MAIKTLAELQAQAAEIRDETVAGANTAVRVGTLLSENLENLDQLVGLFWQHYEDDVYSIGSKFSIAAGVRTKLTIDGVARTEVSPNGYPAVWDVATNKITPIAIDDFYTVRLDMKGWSDSPGNNNFDVEMDIGGAVGVYSADTGIFIKGSGIVQNFNFSSQFFVGSTFLANGAEIYITPLADASFWDIGITISRTYTPIV